MLKSKRNVLTGPFRSASRCLCLEIANEAGVVLFLGELSLSRTGIFNCGSDESALV
jgi:hypothetical protein